LDNSGRSYSALKASQEENEEIRLENSINAHSCLYSLNYESQVICTDVCIAYCVLH